MGSGIESLGVGRSLVEDAAMVKKEALEARDEGLVQAVTVSASKRERKDVSIFATTFSSYDRKMRQ
jgi:hypothetical protein